MKDAAIRAAIDEVLACVTCNGPLTLNDDLSAAKCVDCNATYEIKDGIFHFLVDTDSAQSEERSLRDAVMADQTQYTRDVLLKNVGRHHCLPVMAQRARRFRKEFSERDWLLDLGAGSGWYWAETRGAGLIITDFSLQSLRVARRMLPSADKIVFVWAGAEQLPIKNNALAGVWSVQVMQHLPSEIFSKVRSELNRVLAGSWVMELYNLNPAPFHKAIYRLFGRTLPCSGRVGVMEVNRFSCNELLKIWKSFRPDQAVMSCGYSELFFHPDLRFRPPIYPLRLESGLTEHFSGLASTFARQIHIRLDSRNMRDTV
jgi:ubiquinone/menaquinone biosynthesis C-methylase UbiE/uncharacterized protein YbaR (Trm112 family)